jgi:tetratricopeptide (TPR) repeat protein
MMSVVPFEITDKVGLLIQQGNALQGMSKYREALKPYMEAYLLLPQPKEDWDVSATLFKALGDCNFNLQEYGTADYFYNQVLLAVDGYESAEAWLGIGKSRFELGDMKKAQEAFLNAYMLAGKDIYTDNDIKYFKFLRSSVPLS